MICVKRKFYLEIHPIVALHNHVRRPTFLALVWSVMLKQKKLKKKLWSVSACIWDFRGATIKHLKHHVLPHLVDDTPDIAVLHGGYNDLGYKKKEALSTDDTANAILEIGKLCQSHGVKDIFISSLYARGIIFRTIKLMQ